MGIKARGDSALLLSRVPTKLTDRMSLDFICSSSKPWVELSLLVIVFYWDWEVTCDVWGFLFACV